MDITGPGSPRSSNLNQIQFRRLASGQVSLISDQSGARLVSLEALEASPQLLPSNRDGAKHLVARQAKVALLLTGSPTLELDRNVQIRRDPSDPLRIQLLPQGQNRLPSLGEFAAMNRPPDPKPLFQLELGREPWLKNRPGLELLRPFDRSGARRFQPLGGEDLLGTRRLQTFDRRRGFELNRLLDPPRGQTETFGVGGPFGEKALDVSGLGRRPQVRILERRDQIFSTPTGLEHLQRRPGARSFVRMGLATAEGRPKALQEARQLALGDRSSVGRFAADAGRAFGERVTEDQIRRGAVEALALQPEPGLADYQLLEGTVLASEKPHQEFPLASMAVARGVVYDHGGVRSHLREALQSETVPAGARSRAANFLGAAAGNFQAEDVRALESAAVGDQDKGVRGAATDSLLAAAHGGWLRPTQPEVDGSLERIHLAEQKREGGGDHQLRERIERGRLELFAKAKGITRDQMAESLSQPGNRDETRVEVFDELTSRDSDYERERKAVELGRELTDFKSRNRLLLEQAQGRFKGENDRLVKQLKTPEGEARPGVARLLAESPKATLSDETFAALKAHVKEHGDEDTRAALLRKMPEGPISRADLNRAGEAAQEQIGKAILESKDGDLGNLAKLYQAKGLLENDYRDRAKPGALDRVNEQIEALQKKKSVQEEFQRIATRARSQALGGRDLGAEQANYLTSDAFIDKLEVAGDKMGNTLLKAELAKLQSVDPDRAKGTVEELARKLTLRKGEAAFGRLSQEGRAEAVRQSLLTLQKDVDPDQPGGESLKSALAVGANSNKVVNKLAGTLQEVAKDSSGKLSGASKAIKKLTDQAQQLQNALHKDPEAFERLKAKFGDLDTLKKSVNLLRKLEETGSLGSFGAAVGVHSLVTGGFKFDDVQSGAGTLGSVSSALSGSDDVLKLTGWLTGKMSSRAGGGLTKLGTSLGAKTAFKMLGPVGDTFNMVSEGAKAWELWGHGETGAATVSTLSTLGYTGAAACGLYALIGPAAVAGPVGWVALGLGVAAWGVSSFLGESDEEALLRRQVCTADGHAMRLID